MSLNCKNLSATVRFVLIAGFPISFAGTLSAQPGSKKMGSEFFERNVRPILVEHCYECHSEQEEARKGGLLLDRESGWLEGGDTGKAVIPGQVGASLMIKAVRHVDEDLAMPPKYKLSDDDIQVLTRWVREGAPGPIEDMGETNFSQLGDQEVIFGKAKSHWAFQPVKKVEPPLTPRGNWNQNPIDRFILTKLDEQGLKPMPPADTRTLARRISYDLTGLPPVDPKLFELETDELINKLIDSPQFGEKVARMWLDVARYADTAGSYRPDTKTPHYYPYAFTYRDYVIDSFNEDKPFDTLIREQLAADLMDSGKEGTEWAALGFIGVSPQRNMSTDFVDDVIDATTRGFLGMTVSCARCHDHKFEPVPTADYYSLYGVFGSIKRPAPWDIEDFPLIDGYEPSDGERASFEKELAKVEKEIADAGNKKKKGNNRSLAESIEQTTLAELLLFHDGAPARAMSIQEGKNPIRASILIRGDTSNRGERMPRRFLKILDPKQEPFNEENSGRLDLANKIADPGNPLTARVFVNRIWGMLMGGYIVDTPSDFGLQGSPPTHPELLDYLAADFMENGWSTKRLVRLIVSSQTYRQQSQNRAESAQVDPENRYYWRANRKRLQIEELRDSLLAVSDNLDSRMKGRADLLWGEDYTKRRTIYGYINRFNLDPTLRNFDFPSPMQTQEKRTDNIVSPQALFLMNSPFVVEQAEAVVKKAGFREEMSREQKVEKLFDIVLQRAPSDIEMEKVFRFADIEEGRNVDPWPLLAQSLCMTNEFLYVD